jgi:hypothetical protein
MWAIESHKIFGTSSWYSAFRRLSKREMSVKVYGKYFSKAEQLSSTSLMATEERNINSHESEMFLLALGP